MLGSYPSASVFLFTLAVILIGFALWDLARPWLRVLYILIAALLTAWVCLSQFFLAIHFLTDVLGGMAGATLISWIAFRYLDRDGPRAEMSSARQSRHPADAANLQDE
jgi:membrane-associated phospholipid phosphatase